MCITGNHLDSVLKSFNKWLILNCRAFSQSICASG